MKYKIYRCHISENEIFVDLYNEDERRNLELRFCIYGRAKKLNRLINYIKYNQQVRGDVGPAYLIELYEELLSELDRRIEQND